MTKKVCSVCGSSTILIQGDGTVLEHTDKQTAQTCGGSGKLAKFVDQEAGEVVSSVKSRDYGFPGRHGFDR